MLVLLEKSLRKPVTKHHTSPVSTSVPGRNVNKIIFILFSRVNENEVDNGQTLKEIQLTEKVRGT